MAFCWINECINLRSLVLGDHPYISDFRESILEMLLVLVVWLLVSRATRRVVERANHLESFIRVCAWCRRVHLQGHWVDLEHFLSQGLHARPSHGICEDCLARQRPEMKGTKPRRLRNRPLLAAPHSDPNY